MPKRHTGGHASTIAFASDRAGSLDIYTSNADGTGAVALTSTPAADSDPAWAPGAARLGFVSDRDGHAEIYEMNADGSGQADVTKDPHADSAPSWSPDGTKLPRDGRIGFVVLGVLAMLAALATPR